MLQGRGDKNVERRFTASTASAMQPCLCGKVLMYEIPMPPVMLNVKQRARNPFLIVVKRFRMTSFIPRWRRYSILSGITVFSRRLCRRRYHQQTLRQLERQQRRPGNESGHSGISKNDEAIVLTHDHQK